MLLDKNKVDTIICIEIKCYHKTGSNPILNRFGTSCNIKFKNATVNNLLKTAFKPIFEGYFLQNIGYFCVYVSGSTGLYESFS